MVNTFQQRKNSILSKNDKSSIGGWDKKIAPLCNKINKKPSLYTTSSCSGRIVLMLDKEKKEQGLFLKVYHTKINLALLKKDLNKITSKNSVKFKQEPCILHVVCENLADAQELLRKSKTAGWKKSGILDYSKRIVLELSGTEKLEFPIIEKEKILVDENFLKSVVEKANSNLNKSWLKINRLEKLV